MCWLFRGIQEIETRNKYASLREYTYTMRVIYTMFFQSTFGDTVMKLPLKIPLQSILISWCLFAFLLASGFTAKLISSLVLNKQQPDVNNIHQLLKTNLKVISTESTLEGLKRIYPTYTMVDALINRTNSIQNDSDFERLLETNRSGNAYVMRKYLANYMIHKHYNTLLDRSYYHLMDECVLSLPEVYLAEKGSPYIDYINELLGLFHAHGFFVYWWKRSDIYDAVEQSLDGEDEGGNKDIDENHIKVVITLNHMKAAFCFWGIGILMATTSFVYECICYRYTTFKNRNKVTILNQKAAKSSNCLFD